MNTLKLTVISLIFIFSKSLFAQESAVYTNDLVAYKHAIELYQNKDYVAAQQLFKQVRNQFDAFSENKATCDYYIAFSALHLGDRNGDDMMTKFVENYPTSTKRNDAYREVSDYYYDYGKYTDALKWFPYVDAKGLTTSQEEDFNFKYGYALFSVKQYKKAKNYLAPLLESKKYGTMAKYYYGFMAYQNDDYDNADKYLGEVENTGLGKDVPYFKANIKFKVGKFQEAIDIAEPFLQNANRKQKSDVSKIIGESYFNLKKYGKAVPYLLQYKGKRGKWNNTDYYQLGYAYYMQQDYKNAISWFNKIISTKSAVAQNASYHLAECYIKSDKKQEALNAFRNALEMDYDNEIKKNAWLNYAKLSYEIGNPLKSVPDVLTEYLEKYPKSESKEEINDLLVSSYVTSRDYNGALKLLKNKNDKKSKEIYQKVAFYSAIQNFNDTKYNEAKELLNKSLSKNENPTFTARATYWKAETDYRTNNYNDALNGFTSFSSLPEANNTTEFNDVDYNLAYSNFKLKKYAEAITYFKKYTDNHTNKTSQTKDSYMRLGDSYFVTSDYNNAMNAYDNVITAGGKNTDYAAFQKAISYGFIGKNTEKINALTQFLQNHKGSKFRDEAYYSLGSAYIKANNESNALDAFENVLRFQRSKLKPKALLKQGLIYFNSNRGEEALVKYKKLVKNYSKTAEARQAVNNARQIYINLGRVDEYAEWVQSIDFVSVSDTELDNSMFESADIQYQQNNKTKAIKGFKQYLARFPNGIHALNVNFYLAELFYSDSKFETTKPYYQYIVNQDTNEYTEQALTRLAQVLLKNKDWKTAIPILKRLENEAKNDQNILYAQSNIMKGSYHLEKYDDATTYAEKILLNTTLDNTVKTDAKIIIARSAIKTGDLAKAKTAYADVSLIAQGFMKAEAMYYEAFFKNKEADYLGSNEVIKLMGKDYSTYKLWIVKALVVMGKNFYALKDPYQATLVLNSVINFKGNELHKEAVAEAEIELQKIKTEQAKTNASVVPE